MPTLLPLMGFEVPETVQGRDASALFQGETPADWADMAILRSAGRPTWMAAVTSRYKLVFSTQDSPWLLDREADPFELDNQFGRPGSAEVVAQLS